MFLCLYDVWYLIVNCLLSAKLQEKGIMWICFLLYEKYCKCKVKEKEQLAFVLCEINKKSECLLMIIYL